MRKKEIIGWLDKFGHFDNESFANAYDVAPGERERLDLKDRAAAEAIRSFQQADANADAFAWLHHGRPLIDDGEIGPATLATMHLPRCGVPDHARADATGTGGWPVPGCDPQAPGDAHSVRINLDTRRAPRHHLDYLDECIANVERMAGEFGMHCRYVKNGNPDHAEMAISWESIPGSTIGWNYLPQPGTCAQVLAGRLDVNYRPDAQLFTILMAHEHSGHGFKLGHTRGGVMNPSILRVPLTWRNDPSWNALARMYGGEPIDTPPTPEPPKPGEVVTLTLDKDLPAGTYRLKVETSNTGGGSWF